MTSHRLLPLRRALRSIIVCLLGLSPPLAFAAETAAPPSRAFNLRAEAAERSLKLFSSQSGQDVLFATKTAGQVRTNEVQGNFTPREAMQRLTAGTGLIVVEDARTGAFTVSTDPNGSRAAVPEVPVRPEANRRADASPDENEAVVLSQFVVTSEKDSGYMSANSAFGSRLPNTPLKDLPLSLAVLNSEYLSDLQPTNVADALQFSASWNPETGQIRGLNALQSDGAGVARNGFGVNGVLDASSVDRIEVFKGPASLLYGRAQPGGAINFVSKRATFKRQGSVNLQHGRFNDRVQIAYNQPITKKFAARLALTWQQRDGSNNRPDQINVINDVDHDERRVLNLNTIYRPFKNTEIGLDFEYFRSRENRGDSSGVRTLGGVPYFQLYGMPITYSFISDDSLRQLDHYYINIVVTQKVFEGLTTEFAAGYQWRLSKTVQIPSVDEANNVLLADNTAPERAWRSNWSKNTNYQTYWNTQLRTSYRRNIGQTRHTLSSVAAQQWFYNDFQSLRDYRPGTNPVTGLVNANRAYMTGAGAKRLATEAATASPSYYQFSNVSRDTLLGYERPAPGNPNYMWEYASDNHDRPHSGDVNVLHMGEYPTRIGKFNSVVGGGYSKQWYSFRTTYQNIGGVITDVKLNDRIKYTRQKWNGGLMYQPTEHVGFYGLLSNGLQFNFNNNSFNEKLANPSSKNKEFGVKFDAWKGRIVTTVSVFHTLDFNRQLSIPTAINFNTVDTAGNTAGILGGPTGRQRNPAFNPDAIAPNSPLGDTGTAGQFTSDGVDADVTINLARRLSLSVTYTHLKANVTQDPDPSAIGRRDSGNAEDVVAFFGRYTIGSGPLKNVALGGGYRWSSDKFRGRIKVSNAIGAAFTDYQRPGDNYLTAYAKYDFKIFERATSVQLNVENMLQGEKIIGDFSATSVSTYKVKTPTVARLTLDYSF